ncbi:hypothetical protein E5673_01130 [Sphingomonas sp. PAMC26645]|uniref:hypothetical protein n=1 Tax=Sphingomonas sp. PAMC26645 TaxID=2565555 RepID=UPI00109DA8FD|nr:hypothetical protein [Sphingomonas sp. PAMC26645]QCB40999.1 hypothetical protein E5673_01130 [Sphingomonas sp. PAMC26645]
MTAIVTGETRTRDQAIGYRVNSRTPGATAHPLSRATFADVVCSNRRGNIGRFHIGQLGDCSVDPVSPFNGTLNDAFLLLVAQAFAIPDKTLISGL